MLAKRTASALEAMWSLLVVRYRRSAPSSSLRFRFAAVLGAHVVAQPAGAAEPMAELRASFDGAREVLAISARAPSFAVAAQ